MSKKLRILLADDSRFFRTIEAKFLQNTPAEILETDSCNATFDLLSILSPDLIFMAYGLPSAGGPACCAKIKQDQRLRQIPVVMICDQEDAAEQTAIALAKGCDAVLAKPLSRHQFLQLGRQFLSGIREHRQPSFFRLKITYAGEQHAAKCLDINGGGMFVESDQDIPVNSELELEFTLPNAGSEVLHCRAVVAWLNRNPVVIKPHYPKGFGLKFVDLSNANKAYLTKHTSPR